MSYNYRGTLCLGPHASRGGRRFFDHDLQGLYNRSSIAMHETWVICHEKTNPFTRRGETSWPERREPARQSVSGAGPTTRRELAWHSVSGAGPTTRAKTRRMEETVGPSHPQPLALETSTTAHPMKHTLEGGTLVHMAQGTPKEHIKRDPHTSNSVMNQGGRSLLASHQATTRTSYI
jgi:hypothetical protein